MKYDIDFISSTDYSADYGGTAERLAAYGFLDLDKLPGAPGMPDRVVQYLDPTVPERDRGRMRRPSMRVVTREADGRYRVHVLYASDSPLLTDPAPDAAARRVTSELLARFRA
ncbi:hypothetical protein [Ideonella sp.]|uniref:hypothetical protein n=1 Tax=Ideonella sp. TaxID=1929293 RepID=UPI003BB6C4E5